MTKYTYYIYIGAEVHTVTPIGKSTITTELIDDDTGAYFHRQKIDTVSLKGEDYKVIEDFVESSGCDEAFIDIFASCRDEAVFSGYFSKFDVAMFPDKSTCDIKPQVNDIYRCLYEGWETESNIIQYSSSVAKLNDAVTYEWYYDDSPPPPTGEGWELIANRPITYGGSDNINIYGRQKLQLFYCDGVAPSAPDGTWTILTDAPGILIQFVKGTADLFDINHPQDIPPNHYSITLGGISSTLKAHSPTFQTFGYSDLDINNGIKMKDALEGLVASSCASITQVKSNFLQINPTVVDTDNYVTGDPNKLANILIFQISDVRDPQPSDPAIILNKSLKDILTDLSSLRLRWSVINGNTLEIEHISFYTKTIGLDFTDDRGFRAYTSESQKHEGRTRNLSLYQDKIDFKGVDIIYSGSCTTEDAREDSYQYTADLLGVIQNGSLLDGYVWIACESCETSPNEYYVIQDEGGLTKQMLPNTSLSWANIYKDYYLHESPLPDLNINNTDYSAITVKRNRKQTIRIHNACFNFNPDEDVATSLGQGTVLGTKTSMETRTVEIELLI